MHGLGDGVAVRVNGFGTAWGCRDIIEVVEACPRLDYILLPKCESAEDVHAVEVMIRSAEAAFPRERQVGIMGLIETPRGVANVEAIARSGSRLRALVFGGGDYQLDLGSFQRAVGAPAADYVVLTDSDGHVPRERHWNDLWHFATARIANACRPFGVVPIDVFYDPVAKTHFAPPVEFARVGYGVAVKAGAPKPDISTPEAFKKTLLAAKSVTFLPASAAGSYILRLFERLGIEDAMRTKTVAQDQPTSIVPAVVNGDAELAVFVNNVLIAPGVDIVGPFPAKYQQELVFPAALAVDTKQKEAAKAFVDFIMSPAATVVVKAKGMTPGRS